MKLAKTNHAEIDTLLKVLIEVEWLYKDLGRFDIEDIDFSEYEILRKFQNNNAQTFLYHLSAHLSSINYQRIIWNLRTLLDNCADPNSDTLDYNQDIKLGLELLDQRKANGDKDNA